MLLKYFLRYFMLTFLCLMVVSGLLGQDSNIEPSLQKNEVFGVIKGKILDYETQQPLENVIVTIQGTDHKAQSGSDGRYSISNVTVGHYVLEFIFEGYYSDSRTDVIVRSNRTTFLNLNMLVVRSLAEEVSVTADYFPATPDKPVSQMQINAEELRRDAGSAGDTSRALYSVPGIVKADDEANDLIVRGGSPAENGFYIDNIFVPNINHFPQWGASGGNISMLNIDFIERLDIYTGGFDASYGNRLSSIIDIGYREGNRERIESQVNLSIIGYGAQLEGPFPGKKGSWMISANRSYLDLISEALGSSGLSKYHDIQSKLTYDIDSGNRLSLLAIYGHSQTDYELEDMREEGDDSFGNERYDEVSVGLNWRHLWGEIGYSDTALSYSSIKGIEDYFMTEDGSLFDTAGYRQEWLTFRNLNQIQFSRSHQVKFGFEVQQTKFRSYDSQPEPLPNHKGTFASAFLTYVVYPFSNFSLSSGLRLDYIPFSERTHISPRFSFSWSLTNRLSLNGAFGLFYQQMPIFLIKQDPGNLTLKDPKARHLILGFKYLLGQSTQITLEAYDKHYSNFPMYPGYPYYFLIDSVSGDDDMFGTFGGLVDLGMAFSRGIELTLQKKLSKNFYGLINLTYYRAKYRDLFGEWRNRMYDNRYIFCVSGGYKPNRFWELNIRWTVMGNRAFTTVNEEKSRQYGYPYVELDNIMAGHMKRYNNLSLRVDKRFYFKKTNLVLYAGALNILGTENELYKFWSSRDSAYIAEYMWGRIPYIGFEFEF